MLALLGLAQRQDLTTQDQHHADVALLCCSPQIASLYSIASTYYAGVPLWLELPLKPDHYILLYDVDVPHKCNSLSPLL